MTAPEWSLEGADAADLDVCAVDAEALAAALEKEDVEAGGEGFSARITSKSWFAMLVARRGCLE